MDEVVRTTSTKRGIQLLTLAWCLLAMFGKWDDVHRTASARPTEAPIPSLLAAARSVGFSAFKQVLHEGISILMLFAKIVLRGIHY